MNNSRKREFLKHVDGWEALVHLWDFLWHHQMTPEKFIFQKQISLAFIWRTTQRAFVRIDGKFPHSSPACGIKRKNDQLQRELIFHQSAERGGQDRPNIAGVACNPNVYNPVYADTTTWFQSVSTAAGRAKLEPGFWIRIHAVLVCL